MSLISHLIAHFVICNLANEAVKFSFSSTLVQVYILKANMQSIDAYIHMFLQESFDTSKTITSSDVHRIFENLSKKRRRMQ